MTDNSYKLRVKIRAKMLNKKLKRMLRSLEVLKLMFLLKECCTVLAEGKNCCLPQRITTFKLLTNRSKHYDIFLSLRFELPKTTDVTSFIKYHAHLAPGATLILEKLEDPLRLEK